MRDATRLGLQALGAAAILGLLGDLLLRTTPWGLNAPLWLAALLLASGLLVWRAGLPLLGEGRWLALAALFFAAGIAWRASTALLAVNLLAVLLTLGLAAHRARPGWPRAGGLLQYVGALMSAGFHACGGALVLVFYDVRWREIPRSGWSTVVLAVLRGLLIAIPLLLVFGALFMAADAVFSGLVSNLLRVDVREAMSHVLWVGVWAWLVAGFLRQVLFCTVGVDGLVPGAEAPTGLAPLDAGPHPPSRAGQAGPHPPGAEEAEGEGHPAGGEGEPAASEGVGQSRTAGRVGWLGIVELGVVLGLLDMLFLAFVVVQFRYLFGGAELVQVSETLTYAEYARRGFFELVAVAALLLPIVLGLDWLAKLETARQARVYRVLAGLLVVLLFVVIVSALQRMRLYTQEYGLTELRLYTTAFMLWITAGAVWYLATVLRDHRERYLFGALVAGLVVAATLNVLDPDNLIVRTNAAREDAPIRFDSNYPLLLSDDSTPALIEAFEYVSPDQRRRIARRLLARWELLQGYDWRSWNYGRWRAAEAIAANEAMLREAAAVPPTSPGASGRRDGGGPGSSRFDVPGSSD